MRGAVVLGGDPPLPTRHSRTPPPVPGSLATSSRLRSVGPLLALSLLAAAALTAGWAAARRAWPPRHQQPGLTVAMASVQAASDAQVGAIVRCLSVCPYIGLLLLSTKPLNQPKAEGREPKDEGFFSSSNPCSIHEGAPDVPECRGAALCGWSCFPDLRTAPSGLPLGPRGQRLVQDWKAVQKIVWQYIFDVSHRCHRPFSQCRLFVCGFYIECVGTRIF